jgi:hypothetical protein
VPFPDGHLPQCHAAVSQLTCAENIWGHPDRLPAAHHYYSVTISHNPHVLYPCISVLSASFYSRFSSAHINTSINQSINQSINHLCQELSPKSRTCTVICMQTAACLCSSHNHVAEVARNVLPAREVRLCLSASEEPAAPVRSLQWELPVLTLSNVICTSMNTKQSTVLIQANWVQCMLPDSWICSSCLLHGGTISFAVNAGDTYTVGQQPKCRDFVLFLHIMR